MGKPRNPYPPRSMIWALMAEDWSDLTAEQIAEVFNVSRSYVYAQIRQIRRETGYCVPYVRLNKWSDRGGS